MKSYEGVMEILEAFALTDSYRAAGELAGCSHHTVAHYVALRDDGRLPEAGVQPERSKLIDPHLDKIEEWVERSNGKVRADVVFDKLQAVGYAGSDRTVRRAVAIVKSDVCLTQCRSCGVFQSAVVGPGLGWLLRLYAMRWLRARVRPSRRAWRMASPSPRCSWSGVT